MDAQIGKGNAYNSTDSVSSFLNRGSLISNYKGRKKY